MRKSILVSLFFCFLLAYIIRVLFLPKLALTFGYDQARDAYVTGQILSGDLKILGPPASTPGLYHGVFYYYLLAPAYLLGNGNPIIVAYWIAFLNALVTFIVFYLTYLFTRKAGAALVAALLFAVSFEASQYATWLSNPTIGVWTVPLFYLGLWMWLNPPSREASEGQVEKLGPIITAIGLGLSIQAEVFLLYHLIPLTLWLWVSRKAVKRGEFISFLVFLFLSLSTMIVSEVKFGFRSLSGVWTLLISQDSIIASRNFGDILILYLNQIGRVFSFSLYPGNIGYGSFFGFLLIVWALLEWKKKKGEISWQPYLLSWIFSHSSVVSVGGVSTPFLTVGLSPAVSILAGIFIYSLVSSGKKILAVLLIFLVLFGNIAMIFKENPKGSTIFAIQKDMILKKQFEAIDYTYGQASGKPFSINSLTSPLWINIVWTYLYKWYGAPKYGYTPQWHGRDQIGQLDSLPKVEKDIKSYFLIIEPLAGIPREYLSRTLSEEDSISKLIDEDSFGEIAVQTRVKI